MVCEKELARRLFESQNIHSFIFDLAEGDISLFDGGLRKQFFPSEGYDRIIAWIATHCTVGNIYLMEDFFRLSAVVVPIPHTWAKTGGSQYFIAAPFTFERVSQDDVVAIMQEIGAGEACDDKQLLSFYEGLPVVSSRDKFQSFVSALFPALFDDDMASRSQFIYHYFAKKANYLFANEEAEEIDKASIALTQKRYETENALLECVRIGDEQKAISLHKKMGQLGLTARTSNAVRNIQNFTIILNTLLRKTVEQCGVHSFYIDEVSRGFAISIEQCTSQVQLFDLSIQMIKSYCAQVREHHIGAYSEPIQRCITYIDFHCMEHFSLQELADEVFLNASYLSAQFAKETGQTITAYINRTRVNHALPMLGESTRTIREIANSCGFDDMNYFARVFKKITGVSPTEYRNEHRK